MYDEKPKRKPLSYATIIGLAIAAVLVVMICTFTMAVLPGTQQAFPPTSTATFYFPGEGTAWPLEQTMTVFILNVTIEAYLEETRQEADRLAAQS